MNAALSDNQHADARHVRLLLIDFVRRWRYWFIILPFFLMPWMRLFAAGADEAPPLLVYYPLTLWGPWFSHVQNREWLRSIRTIPVTHASLATVTWTQSVVVFVLLNLGAALVALTSRFLFTEGSSTILHRLPVIFAVTLSLTGTLCFARICLTRASMHRAQGTTRWERHGIATAYRLALLASAGTGFILMLRGPVTWHQVTPLNAGAIAAGLVLTALSYVNRQWLLVHPSSFQRVHRAAGNRHTKPIVFPARWWARHRPYVLATALVFSMTVLTCGLEGCFLVSTGMAKRSPSDLFAGILPFYALAFTVAMTAVGRQSAMRAYRALPVSSRRFVLGEVVRCSLMYAVFAAIACPYAYFVSGRGIALSLGIATACLGASILGNAIILREGEESDKPGIGVFIPFLTYLFLLVFMVDLSRDHEPYVAAGLFVVGGLLVATGASVLHYGVAQSNSPYRIDDATRALMSQR